MEKRTRRKAKADGGIAGSGEILRFLSDIMRGEPLAETDETGAKAAKRPSPAERIRAAELLYKNLGLEDGDAAGDMGWYKDE